MPQWAQLFHLSSDVLESAVCGEWARICCFLLQVLVGQLMLQGAMLCPKCICQVLMSGKPQAGGLQWRNRISCQLSNILSLWVCWGAKHLTQVLSSHLVAAGFQCLAWMMLGCRAAAAAGRVSAAILQQHCWYHIKNC